MELLEFSLLMLAAVLLSSVIDQLVPKVSSPLIQIGLGLLIALVMGTQISIAFDPNLFLVLFIAPLLYDEAKNLDKKALWENKRPVLSLAVGLVIASALIIGFAVNWLVPSIPLAAAFALGAALGPTDAVSVASLSKQVKIPARSRNILESESIINDASGIVSFQFAIAAAVTGTFSLVGATANFFFAFLGGVLVGVALGLTGNFIVRRVRSWGLENTTFHVLFEGGFSAYIMQRVERDRVAALAEQKRQNELRRELAWLSRGARARATKPKFHVAAAQELIADVPPLRDELELKRMAMARLGKQVVDLEHVSVRFDDKTILDDVDWIIGPGDRYGIVGENGTGKTTLLRVIQGLQRPNAGEVKIGKTVRFAVLSQHLDDLSELGDDRVRQVIGRYSRRTMLDGKEMTPAQLLEKLDFKRADLNEPVKDLSGGQKRRLALMLILLDEPNVLILDEPGNDLDTDMLAVVEDLLDAWPGTLLLVTHDRYLMERVTDHQFALVNGKIRHLPGGVDEYLRLSDASPSSMAAGSPARQRPAHAADSGLSGTEASPESSRLSGGEQRTLRKLMQSNERKVETLNGKIEDVRASMAAADPTDFTALGDFQAQISDLQQQIDALEEEWMEAAEKLGE